MPNFVVLLIGLAAACCRFWEPPPEGLSLNGRLLRGFEVFRMGFTRGYSLKIPDVVIQRPLPDWFVTELREYLDYCPLNWEQYYKMLLEWQEDFEAERDRNRQGFTGSIDLIAGQVVSWNEVQSKYLDFMSVIQEVKAEETIDLQELTRDLDFALGQKHILEVQKGATLTLMVILIGTIFSGLGTMALFVFMVIILIN